MKQPVRLGLILGIGVLAMSSATIFIRLAQLQGMPSIVIAAYRLAIAALVITIPAVKQRAWVDYRKLSRREIGMLVLAGLLLGTHFAVWITSLSQTSVVSSVVLVTTTPLWVGLASPILLKEPTPRMLWGGMVLAVLGGVVIGLTEQSGGQASTLVGNALALSGAFLMAGYLMIGRGIRGQLPLIPYLWIVYGAAAVLLIMWAAVDGLPFTGYPPITIVWVIALGLIPQLIGHTAANYAVRYLSATFVGISILGEPIGSTVLAMLILGERPTRPQVLGGALILSGIVLASLAEERKRARSTITVETAD